MTELSEMSGAHGGDLEKCSSSVTKSKLGRLLDMAD